MNLRKIAIITVSSTALSFMPLAGGALLGGDFPLGSDIAHAKNGNSGNGGGGSGAGGNSGNKGGASSKSKSSNSTSNSKSSKSNHGSAKEGNFFKNLFNKSAQNNAKNKPTVSSDATKVAKASKIANSKKPSSIERVSFKATEVPLPFERPLTREKNFHAKLAGLNSLNRNYHAYMNSNDPRMVTMREFIESSIAYEDAQSAAAKALETLTAANVALTNLTDTLVAYDDFSYEGATPEALSARLDALSEIDPNTLSVEDAEKLSSEISELSAIVASDEAAGVTTAALELENAEEAASALEAVTGDEGLKAALLAAAGANRVAEYGEENYVDQEMLDWANSLLGTGDAVGIIDQVREASLIADTEEVASTEEPPIVTE